MENTMNLISEYVNNQKIGYPIFSSDIQKYILKNKQVSPLVINEYINRYEKTHEDFNRYKKGIYYTSIDTVFGKSTIKHGELVRRLYMWDEDEVFGYETGPSYCNFIGLTTQVPKYTFIATNKRQTNINDSTLKLVKPVIEVNINNYKYLQMLDIISNRVLTYYETENYKSIIRDEIERKKINFEGLFYYAKYYKDKNIYKKIAELIREGDIM